MARKLACGPFVETVSVGLVHHLPVGRQDMQPAARSMRKLTLPHRHLRVVDFADHETRRNGRLLVDRDEVEDVELATVGERFLDDADADADSLALVQRRAVAVQVAVKHAAGDGSGEMEVTEVPSPRRIRLEQRAVVLNADRDDVSLAQRLVGRRDEGRLGFDCSFDFSGVCHLLISFRELC